MFIYRRVKTLVFIFGILLFATPCVSQVHHINAQENILKRDTAIYEIENCTAVVALSRDQCSVCTNAMPEMAKRLKKLGFESSFAIVTDRSLMDCKNDELYLLSEIDPQPMIYFLEDKNLRFKFVNDSIFQNLSFETTPALFLFSDKGVEMIPTSLIMDDYGRVNKLSFIQTPCGEKR